MIRKKKVKNNIEDMAYFFTHNNNEESVSVYKYVTFSIEYNRLLDKPEASDVGITWLFYFASLEEARLRRDEIIEKGNIKDYIINKKP